MQQAHITSVFSIGGYQMKLRPGMFIKKGAFLKRGETFETLSTHGFLYPIYEYVSDIGSKKEIVGWEIRTQKEFGGATNES